MSRSHYVNWECDRCHAIETMPRRGESHPPDGWWQTPTANPIDLCANCHRLYGEVFHSFLSEFTPYPVDEVAGD